MTKTQKRFEEVKLMGGSVVSVDWQQKTFCYKCKKPVVWAVTKYLKNITISQNEKGIWAAHYSVCPLNNAVHDPLSPSADLLDEMERQRTRGRW